MPYPDLPKTTESLEEEILRIWEEEHTFRRSLEAREGGPELDRKSVV